jgi:hypothetical protein
MTLKRTYTYMNLRTDTFNMNSCIHIYKGMRIRLNEMVSEEELIIKDVFRNAYTHIYL